MISFEISGRLEQFRFSEGQYQDLLQGPVAQELVRRAIRVETSAKQYATGQGGGPNVRTGRLRGSITWALGADGNGPYVDVGSGVVYAPFVELGTSRMGARPFLRPALQAAS